MPEGPVKVDDAKISPPKRSEMKVGLLYLIDLSFKYLVFLVVAYFTAFY